VSAARIAEPVDAVVVGAGAAGCLYAAKLAQARREVLVLDAGPAWQPRDMISSQIWSRRMRWAGPYLESAGLHPKKSGFSSGWGFGGAANHHYGLWPRLHPEDFKLQSLYGRGLDWPIDYDDLRPYYDRLQEEVGISGDAEAEIWRPPGAPYPMPPLREFRQVEIIRRGFEKRGLHVAPAPMAINSVVYKNRAACLYDGWCDAGCPIGALANPLVTYKVEAEQHGARFRAGAFVKRIIAATRDRIAGVEYTDAKGNTVRQPAALVILAAAVTYNPALLLHSRSAFHPEGIGNASGLVGRYFMTHPSCLIMGLFDEDTEPHMGVTQGNLLCQDAYAKEVPADAFGSYQWVLGRAMKPNDLTGLAFSRPDLIGPELEPFLRKAARSAGSMMGIAEELPEFENRIELSGRADAGGFRQPRTVHGFSDNTLRLQQRMIEEGLEIFHAAGCAEPWSVKMNIHAMGGTIMGSSPEHSVTDSYGRVHGVDNLFIAGSGLYPTAGGVNPTYTLLALGMRATEQINHHWSDYR